MNSDELIKEASDAILRLEAAKRAYDADTRAHFDVKLNELKFDFNQLTKDGLQVRNLKMLSIKLGTMTKGVAENLINFINYMELKGGPRYMNIASALRDGDLITATSLINGLNDEVLSGAHSVTLKMIMRLEQAMSGLLIGEASLFSERTKSIGIHQADDNTISVVFRPSEAIVALSGKMDFNNVLYECMTENGYQMLIESVEHALQEAEERSQGTLPGFEQGGQLLYGNQDEPATMPGLKR